jgi:hypothetical protein
MKTFFHPEPLPYDGTQLRSHFAYSTFGIQGDSIVSFIGPCDVRGDHLVDLEDSRQGLFIHSDKMLHFIIEHFDGDLIRTIAFQRLFVDAMIREIIDSVETSGRTSLSLQRRGNDIFDDIYKLNVSVATASPVSFLIHTGINISSKNTPVPTRGLSDYNINPQAFATGVMNRYVAEMEGIWRARSKVKGVR